VSDLGHRAVARQRANTFVATQSPVASGVNPVADSASSVPISEDASVSPTAGLMACFVIASRRWMRDALAIALSTLGGVLSGTAAFAVARSPSRPVTLRWSAPLLRTLRDDGSATQGGSQQFAVRVLGGNVRATGQCLGLRQLLSGECHSTTPL
jgi:hypothetical protein